jgi:hypothetical protein
MPRYEPKIGHVVVYRLTAHDVEKINLLRTAFAHKQGAKPAVGDEIGVMVTRVWASRVLSGQGFLDGNDSLWIPQAGEGTGIGQWRRQE